MDGFLKLEGGDSNLGNRDIIAGLEWVKKNISAFGGDPAKIIAFGQSAGGTHLVDVIASPLAKGLLAGAIIQSPSAIAQWTNDRQADRAAKLVADAVGAEPTRESMMKVPFEDLAAFGPLAGKLAGDREWAQMTDGNTSLFKGWVDGDQMPMRPIEALRRGAAEGLHVIAGSMASEWRHYIVPNGQISKVNEKAVEKLLEGANLPKDLSRLYKDAGRGEKPGDRFAQRHHLPHAGASPYRSSGCRRRPGLVLQLRLAEPGEGKDGRADRSRALERRALCLQDSEGAALGSVA